MRDDPRAKPALERDAHRFYEALVEGARGGNYYEGYPSKLFDELGINPKYYTPIRRILTETGSITVERKGNRAYSSIWVLNHKPPAQDSWPGDLTGDQVSATLRAEFERRITALEAWRETLTGGGFNIREALIDFEKRIARLEKELTALRKGSK